MKRGKLRYLLCLVLTLFLFNSAYLGNRVGAISDEGEEVAVPAVNEDASFISRMKVYAQGAAAELDMPYEIILAQWALESSWGKSDLSQRANNFAGIKSSSVGKDYTSGAYAGYHSLENFTRDYIRVMNLSFYDRVREANGIEGTARALDESPWAEDTGYFNKIMNAVKSMFGGSVDVGGNPYEETYRPQATGLKGLYWIGGGFLFWLLFKR